MNSLLRWLSILIVAFVFASCGEPERPRPAVVSAQPFRAAGDFDEVGKVSLFEGESCASQIVFVFHGARSTSISMAAPFRVSRILTNAAHDHKTVRVSGRWRRGKAPGCYYVEATQVEAQEARW
ncbi:MAG TPA: hypothetical protein VMO04_03410 [Chthoniobacterales bacterium]|jgi:hypothetical protein|nr:hypothetical protein [Chthoniobacterales bacterium]